MATTIGAVKTSTPIIVVKPEEWSCGTCTYINPKLSQYGAKQSTCDACGTCRPPQPVVVEHVKGPLPTWKLCSKLGCTRRVFTTDTCREHGGNTARANSERVWRCQRCSSSRQWQLTETCFSCKLHRDAVMIRYEEDYFGGGTKEAPTSSIAGTVTTITSYVGNPAAAATELLNPEKKSDPLFACIERHEILRAILDRTELDTKLIGPIIALVVEYCTYVGSFEVGQVIDVAIPEVQFSTIIRTPDKYRWKAGSISTIRGTMVCVTVIKDDYFSMRNGWYWHEWIDIFTGIDRFAPVGSHDGDPWYATYRYPCWQGDVRVLCADGNYIAMDQVRAGDMLISPVIDEIGDQSSSCAPSRMRPQRVQRVVHSRIDRELPMVNMNGMWITRGHPMYIARTKATATDNDDTHDTKSSSSSSSSVIAYDWWRPDECAPQEMHHIDTVYNLILDDGHTVICAPPLLDHDNDTSNGGNDIICCTLGRDCGDRLRRARPDQAEAFGKGTRQQ